MQLLLKPLLVHVQAVVVYNTRTKINNHRYQELFMRK